MKRQKVSQSSISKDDWCGYFKPLLAESGGVNIHPEHTECLEEHDIDLIYVPQLNLRMQG